jgi:hypothetical protein
MSATDLERRLADALRQQADEVMAEADTQARHHDLMRELRRESRSDSRSESRLDDLSQGAPSPRARRAWAVGLAAAAAVAAVVALPAVLPQQTEDREGPARGPETSAVRVAREFVDAFASFDRERAASYLADDAELHVWTTQVGEDVWWQGNRWLEAVGGRIILISCRPNGTSALGDLAECAFEWHSLHSEQLGYDPYAGGLFSFYVDDEEIVWARQSSQSDSFHEELWAPFADWIERTHPEAGPRMYEDWPRMDWESLTPRAIALWEGLSREWVQEQLR